MLSYAKGDSFAFEVLYERHKDALFCYINRSMRSPDVSEDLAHESWLAVIKAAQSYQPTAKFRTYLFRIAHHKIVDFWRASGDTRTDSEAVPVVNGTAALEAEVLLSQLSAELFRLPSEQQQAFILQQEGFSLQEIADITLCEKETAKSRIRYAKQQLRRRLKL